MSHSAVDHAGASRASLRGYLTGFGLAILLTAVPFALVMTGALSSSLLLLAIFAAAVLQIFVHLHYFLHLDGSSAERWNVMAILFTAIIILIVVGGSVWIMNSLHARLMDGSIMAIHYYA